MRRVDEGAVIGERAAARRILQQSAEIIAVIKRRPVIANADRNAGRARAGAQNGDGLGVAILGDEIIVAQFFRHAMAHIDGFGGGGRFVQQRRIGAVHAGQIHHHGLKNQQRLEAALADLRLIRRVGGVPAGIFKEVAQDHRRRVGIVITHADHRFGDLVAPGETRQFTQHILLAARAGEAIGKFAADGAGHRLIGQRIEGSEPETVQHIGDIRFAGADMAVNECLPGLQSGQIERAICHRSCPLFPCRPPSPGRR